MRFKDVFFGYFNSNFLFHLNIAILFEEGKTNAYKLLILQNNHDKSWFYSKYALKLIDCGFRQIFAFLFLLLTSLHRMPYKPKNFLLGRLSFLGVPGVTVGWPRTKGTASNEQVYTFCGFLPNPFIQDLCLWCTSQEFVKTDLYPLSRGLWSLSGMSSVRPGAGR